MPPRERILMLKLKYPIDVQAQTPKVFDHLNLAVACNAEIGN